MIGFLKNIFGIAITFASVYYSLGTNALPTLGGLFHLPSFVLVVGSMFGVSIVLADVSDIRRFLHFIVTFMSDKERRQMEASEQQLEHLVDVYTKGGGVDFKTELDRLKLPRIWNIVATKLSINVPINDVKDILEFQIQRVVAKVDQDIAALKQLSAIAPAMGLFGTILGLIQLLAHLKNFDTIGTNMSLALITTLYGVFIANLILVPLIRTVEKRRFNYIKNHMNLLYWLEHVEQKKPSFYMKKRLRDLDVKTI